MWYLFLLTTVLQMMLAPKPKVENAKPAGIDDFDVPTATSGRVVPVVYGERKIDGGNVCWYGALRAEPIVKTQDGGWFHSDIKQTVGYKYHLGMHLVLCKSMSEWEVAHGSGIYEIMFDDKHTERFGKPPLPAVDKILAGFMVEAKALNKYTQSEVNAGTSSQFRSMYISDTLLFGGEDDGGGVAGNVDFYYGLQGQTASDYLSAQFGTTAPAFRGYCALVFKDFYFGTRQTLPKVSAIVRRYPGMFCETIYNINNNANPVAIIADLYTNKEYGLGRDLSEIDEASFRAVAQKLYDEGLGLSLLYDSQQPAIDAINDVLQHIDGITFIDPTTGKFKIELNRPDYALDDLTLYDASHIVSIDIERKSWDELTNEIEVKFVNRANDFKEDSIIVRNPANIRVRNGQVKRTSVDMYGINNVEAASKVGARLLKSESYPLALVSMTTDRLSWNLRPGAVIRVNHEELGIVNMPCRVLSVKGGTLQEGTVDVELIEDVFGIEDTEYVVESGDWTPPSASAVELSRVKLVETPYHINGEETTSVMTLASRGNSTSVGFATARLTGDTIAQTNTSSNFATSALVKTSVSKTDTTIALKSVIDAAKITTISDASTGINIVQIDDELIAYQSLALVSGEYQLQGCLRGILDTVPASHNVDAQVFGLVGSYTQTSPLADNVLETVRLLAYTPNDVVLWSDTVDRSVQTAVRARRPYLPGNILLNGVADNTTIPPADEIAMLSWNHRNRVHLYNDKRVAGYYEAVDYGAADGNYVVEWLIDGVVHKTDTTVNKFSTFSRTERLDADATELLPITVRLKSRNAAGLDSRVVYEHTFNMEPSV